jgi:hypothetical protein
MDNCELRDSVTLKKKYMKIMNYSNRKNTWEYYSCKRLEIWTKKWNMNYSEGSMNTVYYMKVLLLPKKNFDVNILNKFL